MAGHFVMSCLSVHRMIKGKFDDDDDDGIDLDNMEKFLPGLPVRNYYSNKSPFKTFFPDSRQTEG